MQDIFCFGAGALQSKGCTDSGLKMLVGGSLRCHLMGKHQREARRTECNVVAYEVGLKCKAKNAVVRSEVVAKCKVNAVV